MTTQNVSPENWSQPTFNNPDPETTGIISIEPLTDVSEVSHSGNLSPEEGQELPVQEFQTPLSEAVARNLVKYPEEIESRSFLTRPKKIGAAVIAIVALAVAGGVVAKESTGGTSKGRVNPVATSTLNPGARNSTNTGGPTSKATTETLPDNQSALDKIAQQYGVIKKTVSWDTYYQETQNLAKKEGLPNTYYDLATITKPLTNSDFEQLAPILLNNALLAHNTSDPSYIDIGVGSFFSKAKSAGTPHHLMAIDGYGDYDNQTFKTFDAVPTIEIATYDGPTSQYDDKQVRRVTFKNVHVKTWDTTSDAAIAGTLGGSEGSFDDLELQYDLTTNTIIGFSDVIHD